MDLTGIGTALVGISSKVIDKLFPDPAEAARAKAELLRMQQEGELKELEVRMSAIPMGALHAVDPQVATNGAAGVGAWLKAIPEEMWWLFGAGYLGYAGARTMEKRKGAN